MKSETNVGDEIEQTEAGWEFDDDVAQEFDRHVNQSIPNYRKIQDQVVKLVDWFTSDSTEETIYDLGCATATTIKLLIENGVRSENREYVGIDEARPMLEQAYEKIDMYDNVRLLEEDITERRRFPNATVVLSLFTLSFLPETERATLLKRVYNDLDKGGALIFVEKTYPEYARSQSMFREHYWDYKQQHFDPEEIVGKASTLRGQLRPLSRGEYRTMLEDAGFDEIEPWYQYYMWWGVIARKQ